VSKPILVPLDGSELSQRALPYATALARTSARPLILVRVLTPKAPRGEELVQEDEARTDLNANAERLRAEGLAVLTVLASTLGGDVAHVILEYAEAHGCDLIVMSTHGRSGLSRWVYGSTAEKVLRQAPLPLLLVPATSDQEWPTNGGLQVLVPFDGSAEAESALEPMLASIRDITKHVLLLQVVVAPRGGAAAYMFEDLPAEIEVARASLERVAQMLRGEGLTVGIQVVAGSVAASIASVARQESVDLIAMATHGRSGFARLVLGSVAAETLQRATTPLLVCGRQA